jgi:transposase
LKRWFRTITSCAVSRAVLDLSWVHVELAPYYPKNGRPSIDPVLMIRLIIGYVFGIRSERLLCREVKVNMAYRWFCKLSIEDQIPDHSVFSRARNERFRNSDIFRRVFERVVQACISAGLVGGEGFAVDASLIVADAGRQGLTDTPSRPGSLSPGRDPCPILYLESIAACRRGQVGLIRVPFQESPHGRDGTSLRSRHLLQGPQRAAVLLVDAKENG